MSPEIAATIQIMEPIAIAAVIPEAPDSPVAFKIKVENSRVAIAIPDTGLLELPTRPTIREDTAAKKKPNTTTMIAPSKDTGIAGTSHTAKVSAAIAISTTDIGRSCSVRILFTAPFWLRLAMESVKVRTINGKDLIKLMIPPAAKAPAPI